MKLTQERLKELLRYDPETGVFTWHHINGRVAINGVAGCPDSYGYLQIRVDGTLYLSHRLAWLYLHGYFPVGIDHINGIKNNNRISNLREVSHSENMQNKKIHSNNTSGVQGVSWQNQRDVWCAYINVNGKRLHIGSFKELNNAIKARKSAESKHNYHPNHGRAA